MITIAAKQHAVARLIPQQQPASEPSPSYP